MWLFAEFPLVLAGLSQGLTAGMGGWLLGQGGAGFWDGGLAAGTGVGIAGHCVQISLLLLF